MVKKAVKPAAPVAPVEDEEAGGNSLADKEPGDLHIAFADWVKEEFDEDIDPRAVQLAWGARNKWRKTPAYAEAFGKEVRAAARAKAEEQKAARKAEKEAAAESAEETPKPARGRRGKQTSAEALAEAEAEQPKANTKKGKGRTPAF